MKEAPSPTLCSLLSRSSSSPHRLTASLLFSSALPSLFAPTEYCGSALIDHGMPDVAVVHKHLLTAFIYRAIIHLDLAVMHLVVMARTRRIRRYDSLEIVDCLGLIRGSCRRISRSTNNRLLPPHVSVEESARRQDQTHLRNSR